MRVRQILLEKPDGTAVATIAPTATLKEVTELLCVRHIGALVVSQEGKTIAGMISERDIVRELGQRGVSALQLQVADVMTRKVITAGYEDEATVILEKMTLGRFRHIPVVEEGALVGLVSIGDVVKARLSQLDMEKRSLEGMIMGF